MKRKYLILPLLLGTLTMNAESNIKDNRIDDTTEKNRLVKPLTPTYLDNVVYADGWASNWFIEAKGGISAFMGKPVGCGDFFDRIMPTLNVGLGKWFTPSVGARVGYQGFQFKNANLEKMKYYHLHADLMINLTPNLQPNEYGISKFDVIPFVGLGLLNNTSATPGYLQANSHSTYNKPFAFNYGIEFRYRALDRLHIVGEISGISTIRHFDCVGTSSKMGDNMLNVSVGISYTFGKRGWKRVIDAQPYINQNNYLLDHYAYQEDANNNVNSTIVATRNNNYSGLNSLRERMNQGALADTIAGNKEQGYDQTVIAVGVPIHFYFKINTADLVDKTQLSNLKEIAKIAKEQNLIVHISAAADSATGKPSYNKKLAAKRGNYIAKQLKKLGVPMENMRGANLGGINTYSPIEANRTSIILLTFNQ